MNVLFLNKEDSISSDWKCLEYGIVKNELGVCLVGCVGGYLCRLSFDKEIEKALIELQKKWSLPLVKHVELANKMWLAVCSHLAPNPKSLKMVLKGTPFQLAVWKALTNIPHASTCSYLDVANQINNPKAVRAVGQAVGANPICIAVPCHRVLRNGGQLGGFAYGLDFKKYLLSQEKNNA